MSALRFITGLTYREAVRRRIALAGILLGVAFLLLYSIGFHFIRIELSREGTPELARREFTDFFMLAGLYAVNFLSVAMSALVAADSLSGEIGSGAIQSIATKPLRRAEIVLGKWLGYAVLIALYLLMMAGGVVLSVWLQSGSSPRNALPGISLMLFESLLIMSISLACSSRISTLATGGVVFGMFGLAFVGGWVEQIGTLLQNQTAFNVGIISSLLVPTEALWKRAAYIMSSPLVRRTGATPFSYSSMPSDLMLVYAAIYLLIAVTIAVYSLSKRDL
jgi:ABC-type transport system involved in multi-copper enzyme maturation permease subunit